MILLRGKLCLLLLFAVALLLIGRGPAAAHAASDFRDGFEGAEPSWRVLAADTRYHIDQRLRVHEPVHSGAWSEALTVTAGDGGTYIQYGREIGAARIIDELNVSLWMLADRPGLQLNLRVVLPRSVDPQTGRARTILVYGPMYEQAGKWQELVVDRFPERVDRQIRFVQGNVPTTIDGREAYVDAVLLNVFGGRGTTHVWIDDLAVAGFVGRQMGAAEAGTADVRQASFPEPESGRPAGGVVLRGSVLTVAGRPILPRIVEHRGESLMMLKRMGFNGVKLAAAPSGALLAEAAEARMWIVAPPPRLDFGERIGRQYDPVLMWDVGESLSHRDLAATEALIRQIREADREFRRPIICDAATELKTYSQLCDLLVIGRRPLGTSLELGDYAAWQRQRGQLARPGTAFWTAIQTQPDELWQAQLAAFSPGSRLAPDFGAREIRQLVLTAIAGGSRGLLFESRSSLAANDAATRRRGTLLELVNLELALIENWAAAGNFVTPATSSDPAVTATVIETDRARLLLPLRCARGDQFVVDEGPGGDVTFVAPGVPESNDAFELTPAGLRPLPHQRVTGGMSVTLHDPAPAALIVLTQDPLVIENLTRAAAAERRTAADLTHQLAADELLLVEGVDRRLVSQSLSVPAAPKLLATARDLLGRCDAALVSGDEAQSLFFGRAALRPLGELARAHSLRVSRLLGSPMAVPYAASFSTLPLCASFVDALRAGSLGENLLAAGDFEDLDQLRRAGWQHFQLPQRLIRSDVELSTQAPHGGLRSLRLSNTPLSIAETPALVESPPLWITSAPVLVAAGQIVQIHGWVRVSHPITASVDGLMIVDSLGGDALAERVGQTRGWQEFTLYRAAPTAGSLTVTFALAGLGEAFVDDVTIRPLSLPQSNAGPQANRWAPTYAPPRLH